jgi:hypothetical protein
MMNGKVFRRIVISVVIILPLFISNDCKKQAKCGCEGDVLFSFTKEPSVVTFNETGTSVTFVPLSDSYSYYYFCNPGEMISKLKDFKSGDVLQVSGDAFWECNYLYQSSNSQYQVSYMKIYVMKVTDVSVDLYGKK